jgi:FlaA1/EpsC-like NDP-sugar epimerase
MARVELFDAGRLLASFARDRATSARRRWAKLSVPFYVAFDVMALVATFFIMLYVMQFPVTKIECRVALPIRVTASFASLIFFRTYVTVWSRAMTSNFARMFVACAAGAVAGSIGLCCAPNVIPDDVAQAEVAGATLVYFLVSFLLLSAARLARPVVRDVFYALDCARLKGRKDVSRVLVYGAGLRYRAYRRELVRTTSANDRMIVGLMDDDILLRGQYVGGIKVYGTLLEAPEIINRLNVDSVVVACEVTDAWLKVVKETLGPTGVKVTHFKFEEKEI